MKRIYRDVERLTSFTEDIRAAGFVPGSRTIRLRLVKDPERLFGGSKRVELIRVRAANGKRICVERTYLPAAHFELLRGVDLRRKSLYEVMRREGEVLRSSKEVLEARLPDASERKWLGISAATPVVAIERRAFDARGRLCELTRNTLVARRYLFRFSLKR